MIDIKKLPDHASAQRLKKDDWIFIEEWSFQGLCRGWWQILKIQHPISLDPKNLKLIYNTKVKPLPPADDLKNRYLFQCKLIRKDVHIEDEDLTGYFIAEKRRVFMRMKPVTLLE